MGKCLGRFDRIVSIQQRTDANDYGRVVKSWSDWKTGVRTKLKSDTGNEVEMSSKETAINKRTYIFRTKTITGLTEEMKLVDTGKEFDIIHIGAFGREKYLEVIAKSRE